MHYNAPVKVALGGNFKLECVSLVYNLEGGSILDTCWSTNVFTLVGSVLESDLAIAGILDDPMLVRTVVDGVADHYTY